jgi:hypothetical protein
MKEGQMDSQTLRVRAHERHLQALELRKAGATYEVIAHQLGYASARGAHKAVASALKTTLREPADAVRELELTRLDAMLLPLWRRVQKGDERAIDRALKIEERRAKLLGLEAPTRIAASEDENLRIEVVYVDTPLPGEEAAAPGDENSDG